MAIFTNTTRRDDAINLPVYEGYGIENNEYMNIFMESLDDNLAVIEAMHSYDMNEILGKRKIKALIESKTESDDDYKPEEDPEIDDLHEELTTTLEAEGEKVKKTLKERIKNFWAKIIAFFDSIKRFFTTLKKTNTEFYTKYNTVIGKLKTVDFEVLMHPYDTEKLSKAVDVLTNPTKNMELSVNILKSILNKAVDAETAKENVEKSLDDELNLDKVRGKILGVATATGSEFSSGLYKQYRGYAANSDIAKQTVKIDKSKLTKYMDFVKNADQKIIDLERSKKTFDNSYKMLLTNVDTIEDDKKLALFNKLNNNINGLSQIYVTAAGIWSKAVAEAASAFRVVLRKAITKDAKANID